MRMSPSAHGVPGRGRHRRRSRGGRLRRRAQARARRACGSCRSSRTAPGWTKGCSAAGSSRGRRSSRPASPINVTHGGAFPRGDFNADGTGGDRPNAPAASVKQGGWSQDEYLAGIFRASGLPDARARRRTATCRATRIRGPGYVDVSLSLSKKFGSRSSGPAEFRLDAFNAFNRVNLADPNMDLSSTNFGRADVAAHAAGDSVGGQAQVLTASNPKLQVPNPNALPSSNSHLMSLGVRWDLGFGSPWSLGFGAWDLILLTPPSPTAASWPTSGSRR